MCGIWALFGADANKSQVYEKAFSKIPHRGPDAWRLECDSKLEGVCIGFCRLEIVSTPFGMQPMKIYANPDVTLLCNGEIYNYKQIGEKYGFKYETGSDVECIIHLYTHFGIERCAQELDGVFAFALIDSKTKHVYLGRDPFGVRPLFRLNTTTGFLGVCSEAKGLIPVRKELNGTPSFVQQFPPSTIADYLIGKDSKVSLLGEKLFYAIGSRPSFSPWISYEDLTEDIYGNIRKLLTSAVEKRLMSDRRIGCLLSGGLDSSLISALLVKLSNEKQLPYKVQSFAIGMGSSPDILAARQVAQHIGCEHHEISFTEDDVINSIDNVIYYLETADITTIRASVGMYLLSRYIKENTNTTVIFSGEGADELAQGYIYFRDAPSSEEASAESYRLLSQIYLYDGLRADRSTSAHSLEIRVPFLDQQFTNYFLNLPAEIRRPQNGVEKHLLRSAFEGTNLLPHSILWRHKEAFSDGVASIKRSLFQIIQDFAENKVTDLDLENAAQRFPHLTPKTKESYYYREVFEKHYSGQAEKLTPAYWMPRWINVSDPSARFIKHYAADKEQ